MELSVLFKRLGLPKHSYDVYYVVLQNKETMLASHIIQQSGTHRPAAYRAIAALCESDFLIKSKKGKRTYYHATNPKNITSEYSKFVASVSDAVGAIESDEIFLPNGIRYFEGAEGIRDVFDDVVQHTPRRGTFYRYTSEKNLAKVNSYLSKDYRKKRDAKKLERMVISNSESGTQKKPRLERFIKFMPQDKHFFKQDIIQLIYGDRLAFIDLSTKKSFIIENETLANFQKAIFKELYKRL